MARNRRASTSPQSLAETSGTFPFGTMALALPRSITSEFLRFSGGCIISRSIRERASDWPFAAAWFNATAAEFGWNPKRITEVSFISPSQKRGLTHHEHRTSPNEGGRNFAGRRQRKRRYLDTHGFRASQTGYPVAPCARR